MKVDRTGILDHPTLEQLQCLIMCPDGSKGFNAEAILLQQIYGLCLVYGFGRVYEMMEGIYDIWLNPNGLPEYQKKREEHIAAIQKGLKIYNEDAYPILTIEPKVDIRQREESRRIREESRAIRQDMRTQAENNKQQQLANQQQALDNLAQSSDNQGQALDNQQQAIDNRNIRKRERDQA